MGRHHQAINMAALVTLLVMAISSMPIELSAVAVAAAGNVRPMTKVPAARLYVFGDSTEDVGNNNYLPGDFPRADRPYYGVDFPGGRSTGRWSNGYNIADFVARCMGFKRSPPAYLSLTPRSSRVVAKGIRGASYASAGAGILDSTYIPLSEQVRLFGETRAQMVARLGACAANELLSTSLFLISIGNNDIAVFAAATTQQVRSDDVAALYASLISNYTAAITELYGMGARKFGIVNVGLIGCTPSSRARTPTGTCADGANALAAGFNDELRSLLGSLSSRLHGVAYSIGDLLGLMQATIANPRAAGLRNVDSACCGGGRLGAQSACQPNSTLCADRRRYLFWDAGHPTQRAAQLIVSAFYDGPAQFTVPVNLKKLLRLRSVGLGSPHVSCALP
ncbi:hypothetical protein BS78_09G050400 [Paspalum vaginatum]|nr:hypothetical protein BS78_09G050400 [Paspalum vaginatum]